MKTRNGFIVIALAVGLLFSGLSLGTKPVEALTVPECIALSRDLFLGTSNSNVIRFQEFLRSRGLFSATATGFFGPLTFRATQRFQASMGVSATGYVGPRTRAALEAVTCGGIPHTQPILQNISPVSGGVGTTVTLTGSGFTQNNTVFFGSGILPGVVSSNGTMLSFSVPESLSLPCHFSTPACLAPNIQVTPGTYAVVVRTESGTSNTLTFTVTQNTPPVGVPRIDSISPTAGPVGTVITIHGAGFNNANRILLDGWVNVNVPASGNGTQITFTLNEWNSPDCEPDRACILLVRSTSPGVHEIRVKNSLGTSAPVSFRVTSGESTAPPVVTGLDATTHLTVGQQGTWTVHTQSSGSNQLRYSVIWGDEAFTTTSAAAQSETTSISNSATFTHVFTTPGIYAPRFTVTDSLGRTASASASVNVTQ